MPRLSGRVRARRCADALGSGDGRGCAERVGRAFVAPGEPIRVGAVEECAVPIGGARIQTRIFKPAGEVLFPILLWFHGGGWVVGSLDESDAVCRSLCSRAEAIVLCPDYRMAPEYRFPVAAEDCYAIAAWAAEAGDSFGAIHLGLRLQAIAPAETLRLLSPLWPVTARGPSRLPGARLSRGRVAGRRASVLPGVRGGFLSHATRDGMVRKRCLIAEAADREPLSLSASRRATRWAASGFGHHRRIRPADRRRRRIRASSRRKQEERHAPSRATTG